MSARETRRAAVIMIALVVLWGYSWITSKIGLYYASPLDFSVARVLLGALSLLGYLLWSRAPLRPQHVKWALFIGMVQTAGFIILNTWALSEGGPGKISVLVFTMPFWVLIFAWPVLGERIRGWQWLAIGLAFAGLLLVLQPWNLHTSLVAKTLALLAGICWAIGVVCAKRLHNRAQVEVVAFTFWQMAIGAIPILLIDAVFDTQPIQWTGTFVFCALFNGVMATGLGWAMWLYVLHRLPAGTTSLSSLGVPVIAGVSSWLQLGERPASIELAGMLLIGVALALISWLTIRKHEETEPLMGQE
ncbi:MAG TPA: EamA family transporter [Burkholderiales bacterium]|nr:EamA family transporter [Burkholderiales bacterium]